MIGRDPAIRTVGKHRRIGIDPDPVLRTTLFEQPEVVATARGMHQREDPSCVLIDHQLRFDGVPLLLAAVVGSLLLFFFGRLIGVSVASMTMTS